MYKMFTGFCEIAVYHWCVSASYCYKHYLYFLLLNIRRCDKWFKQLPDSSFELTLPSSPLSVGTHAAGDCSPVRIQPLPRVPEGAVLGGSVCVLDPPDPLVSAVM